ncbi:hypothetical protein [Paenibacillus sp.]|jgi:hypothetical protein|uniref:hypothetical protein n=1 Tax=Paenibacillus sp. TaxID=58172 RepID=UPI002821EF51|nr:hypothetical protein [Paenibacillus sp.]MDR0268984.1 hypothetical protein [Paenibacillus sp.]
MWIFENFYWILIIGFAVISALSKSAKSKPKQNPRGMPTFGGGNGMEQRTRSAAPQASESRSDEREPDSRAGWGELGDAAGQEGWDSDTAQHSQRSYEFQGPGPDYETGEGVSGMWEEDRPETLADYDRAMEQHLEQVNASLNRIEKMTPAAANQATGGQPDSRLAGEARKGIIWAEVLGPPRSKRPYGGRK